MVRRPALFGREATRQMARLRIVSTRASIVVRADRPVDQFLSSPVDMRETQRPPSAPDLSGRRRSRAMGLFRVRGGLTGPTGRSEDADLLVDTGAALLVVPRSLAERP